MKAICASINFDLFMVLPRPPARITHAAKLEFSSKDRSENREASQSGFEAIQEFDIKPPLRECWLRQFDDIENYSVGSGARSGLARGRDDRAGLAKLSRRWRADH